jgi:putative ABC transport system ATP-binding protein
MSMTKNMCSQKNTKHVTAIELRNVVHTYGSDLSGHKALHFDEWSVGVSEHVFLYGDSGSGKSTLLNLLSGILTPKQGSINVFGTELSALSNSQRDRFRAQNIGVVFQQFNLIPYLSVLKNIELAAYLARSPKKDISTNISRMVSALQLPDTILNAPVSRLSVGQQQRVAIMRAFINTPQLLLIDEPTSALDNSAKSAFMTHLLEMCQYHKTTMVFVSHDTGLKHFFSNQTPISSFCNGVSNERAN